MPRILEKCTNFADLRDLARRRLPSPIFNIILMVPLMTKLPTGGILWPSRIVI